MEGTSEEERDGRDGREAGGLSTPDDEIAFDSFREDRFKNVRNNTTMATFDNREKLQWIDWMKREKK